MIPLWVLLTSRIPWWGIIVPAAIFIIAFVVTWLLYRHFAARQ